MRGSNIGHAIRIRIRIRRAWSRGEGSGIGIGGSGSGGGLDWVGGVILIIIGAAIAAIGCILGVANERLEKGLVPGTHGGQGGRRVLLASQTRR